MPDRRSWLDVARRAEDAGFSTLQTADHIGDPDPFLPLVAAAGVTSTLRFGPLVVNAALHHPALVARSAATADVLTDGRIELGLGTGWALAEHVATGIPLPAPAPRVDHFEAALTIVTALLRDGSSSSTGGITADVEALGVTPVQRPHPPLLVGAHGRRMIRVAAQHAQVVQLTGLTLTDDGGVAPGGFEPEVIDERVAWLRHDAGERFDAIELSILVQVTAVTDDAATVIAARAERAGVPPALLETTPFMLIGSVSAIVEKLVAIRERYGVSYITVRELDAFAPVIAALAGR
jgi:probable F420-dependent oxidoreductase